MKTRKKKLLVTIDWDYWVPEKLEWDMGHRESQFFLEAIWAFRGQLIEHMKTTGEELAFWDHLRSKLHLEIESAVITESWFGN